MSRGKIRLELAVGNKKYILEAGETKKFEKLERWLENHLLGSEAKQAVEEASQPHKPASNPEPPVCKVCGTAKIKSTYKGNLWWKCPNYHNH